MRRLTWLEREGVLVLVASRSLDDAALQRVAEELVLDGDAFVLPQVPGDLEVAFDGRTAYIPGLGLSAPAGEGYVVALGDRSVYVRTLAGDERAPVGAAVDGR
ncbi:MAG: hypothetical protein M3R01_01420 [Actinomycetota bacterium]|nr:hypothetical protein [Actinomycetota bacterium]